MVGRTFRTAPDINEHHSTSRLDNRLVQSIRIKALAGLSFGALAGLRHALWPPASGQGCRPSCAYLAPFSADEFPLLARLL